ncbi:MAG: nitrogen fixation protein FixH [Methylocystaceae bacterium]|nr:MAG: nitrogen fixation protein FixH [Methylocystaceae bacterium]
MSVANSIRDDAGSRRRLTGGKVLALLVAFFGLVGGVNAAMIYFAVTTFRGEDASHAYERGLAYNRDIAVAREQGAREWKVEASLTRRSAAESLVGVSLRDASDGAISGLRVSAAIRAPVDGKKDIVVELVETAPGRYEAPAAVQAGWRDLVVSAERDGREVFRSKSRIRIE